EVRGGVADGAAQAAQAGPRGSPGLHAARPVVGGPGAGARTALHPRQQPPRVPGADPRTAMTTQVGYCTNVHAGVSLLETREKLEKYALAVKARVQPNEPMSIGLWLPAPAAREILQGSRLGEWKDWLAEVGLLPFTFNGFPYGDFHEKVVKHRVYEPTWADPARMQYTLDLIEIQHALLPPGVEGSISTLPLFWGRPEPSDAQ